MKMIIMEEPINFDLTILSPNSLDLTSIRNWVTGKSKAIKSVKVRQTERHKTETHE